MATSCADGLIPSGPASAEPGIDLSNQAGHADHEELVQVGAQDREELHALQKWVRFVLRFLENAVLKGEQAEFAIEDTVTDRKARAARPRRRGRLRVFRRSPFERRFDVRIGTSVRVPRANIFNDLGPAILLSSLPDTESFQLG